MKYFIYLIFLIATPPIYSAHRTGDSVLIQRMQFVEGNFRGTGTQTHTQVYLIGKTLTGEKRDLAVKIFAEKFAKSPLEMEHSYTLLFFNETDVTNVKHLQERPGDINASSGFDISWIYNISRRPGWVSLSADKYVHGNRTKGGYVKHLPRQ